jgi:hypothetical protein
VSGATTAVLAALISMLDRMVRRILASITGFDLAHVGDAHMGSG